MKTLNVKPIDRQFIDNREGDSNIVYVPESYYCLEIEDSAFFSPGNYKSIFGKERKEEGKKRKLIAIVRIQNGRHVIYRKYMYDRNIVGLYDNEHIGLTFSSLRLLAAKGQDAYSVKKVDVLPGSWFMYYCNHPFHATRVAFRVGLISLIISFASLILTLLFRFL